MSADIRAAAKRLLQLRQASESFDGFVRLIHPTWDRPDFHQDMIAQLDAFERDDLPYDNLLLTMPPRHAKSTIGTVLFPAYYMARDPMRFVMSCSYNAELATGFGREVRDILERSDTAHAFPDLRLHQKFTAADAWVTEAGGKYNAMGIGGTTSGRPATLLVVDDPIKAREDAESMTQRNKTWNYYTSALTTRLQPTHDGKRPKQIVVLTRWHPDDLAGRLMQTPDWEEGRWGHINYKAITTDTKRTKVLRTELPIDHPLFLDRHTPEGRAEYKRLLNSPVPEGQRPPERRLHVVTEEKAERALWPERFPLEELKRKERLSPHDFASLYQQEPFIKGGNLIKSSWWRTIPPEINLDNPEMSQIIIAVDTAFKKTEQADYSVAVIAGLDSIGDIHILDLVRARMDYPELRSRLIHLNNRWRGRGLRGMYVEDKASGMSIIQDLRKVGGIAVLPYKVVGDKVSRLQSVLPLIQGGRVHLPASAPWLDTFSEEAQAFPNSTHDDQIDALTMALDVLSKTGIDIDASLANFDVGQSLNQQARPQQEQLNSNDPWDELSHAFPRDGQTHDPHRATQFGKSLNRTLREVGWKGWGL